MPKNHEYSSGLSGESGWESFAKDAQEEAPYRREKSSVDKKFDFRTKEQIHKQQKAEALGRMRAEIFSLFKSRERTADDQIGARLSNADREVLLEQEAERRRSEEALAAKRVVSWNMEYYGADIPAASARNAFSKEFFHLQLKIEKDQRATEKEKNMSPKERRKSHNQRKKRGEIVTPAEREQFRELESIQNFGNEPAKEDYGRRKERAFREASENMKANKRKFKKILKERGLSMPKTWDDKTCSLADLQHLNNLTMHLRPKE